jgi:hypothetical protein
MARKNVTSVITGDLINSRKIQKPSQWLEPLKKALRTEVKNPADTFLMAIGIPVQRLKRFARSETHGVCTASEHCLALESPLLQELSYLRV